MELIGAAEVKQLLGVGNNRAYEIIRQLNAELEQKGYLTIRGKIPKAYLLERFYHETCVFLVLQDRHIGYYRRFCISRNALHLVRPAAHVSNG